MNYTIMIYETAADFATRDDPDPKRREAYWAMWPPYTKALTGSTDWEAVALLYKGLLCLAPTIGALVGRAAAIFTLAQSRRVCFSCLRYGS